MVVMIVILIALSFIVTPSRNSPSVPQNSPTPTIELALETKTDEELIKEALIAKHDWDPAEISITISQNDGKYATGGAGSVTPGPGGGIWFATKIEGNWQIVWDGNGMASCDDLAPYPDFPATLIPQCYDSITGELVTR